MVDTGAIEPIEAETASPASDRALCGVSCGDPSFEKLVEVALREAQEILDGLIFDEEGPTDSADRWRKAADAWADSGWKRAAREYHEARASRTLIVEIEPERLALLHRLGEPNVSLDRAWHEINSTHRAAHSTVEALLYELRAHGLAALEPPSCRRRLADVSSTQVRDVIAALIPLRPNYPTITDDLLLKLGEQL